MKRNPHSRTSRHARVYIATALATVLLAAGSTGSARAMGNSESVFVSGNSTFSDCGLEGSDLALQMTGDLQGCWSVFVESSSCKELGDFALYQERGREVFVGTLHGKQGRFRTTYTLDGAYEKGFCQSLDFSRQVAGGCTHQVYGRSGVFRKAGGLITFFDVVAGITSDPVTGEFAPGTGASNFLYFGRIHLDD
jgi:hypothetical protein